MMGLDQHRAQITAEGRDTDTGEVSRRRIRPADRLSIRRFLAQFEGMRVEAAGATAWTTSGRSWGRHVSEG